MFSNHGIFKRIGDSSSGLYLFLVPAMTILFAYFGMKGWPFFSLYSAVSLVVAIGFGLAEHKIHSWLAQRVARPLCFRAQPSEQHPLTAGSSLLHDLLLYRGQHAE
jgi:hypothetical protein